MLRYCTILVIIIFMAACRPTVLPPKPPGYFRIDTPFAHVYQLFDRPGYPYTFEYPVYAEIQNDTAFQGEKAQNPYWININFPSLNGVINLTYKEITPEQTLNKLVDKAWELSFFHHEKADYINTKDFSNGFGVAGELVYSRRQYSIQVPVYRDRLVQTFSPRRPLLRHYPQRRLP